MGIKPKEELPPGANSSWTEWRCLNRLRTRVGRSKVSLQNWGYLAEGQDATCECGTAPQTMDHLLVCPQMGLECTSEDLAEFNDSGRYCASFWLGHI